MAAVGGVARATGRVMRRGSHAPARPLRVGAVASPATCPCGQGGRPRWGARERGESRRRAPSRLTIKLVVEFRSNPTQISIRNFDHFSANFEPRWPKFRSISIRNLCFAERACTRHTPDALHGCIAASPTSTRGDGGRIHINSSLSLSLSLSLCSLIVHIHTLFLVVNPQPTHTHTRAHRTLA